MKAPVLIIGSGAREHALAWKLSQSPEVLKVIVAPGNDGMGFARWPADLGTGTREFERLAALAREAKVALAVIGPDNALADGIVDVFEKAGVPVFGPRQAAARIESSKIFAKETMDAARVPTAEYRAFSHIADAEDFIRNASWDHGWVVKADGLALGKGVRVCTEAPGALRAARELIGISGELLIEEQVSGEELSLMAICDGTRAALLEPARDYKRVRDGDEGPNTGGMGAFSPVPGFDAAFSDRLRREVFEPVLAELKHRGAEFRGILYAGLMVDRARDRYWVLEFNSRFGDPEAEVLLPRIEGDLYPWLLTAARGDLRALPGKVPFVADHAVYVVAAAEGYPEDPRKGDAIEMSGGEENYFFAGVRRESGALKTSGGRVLGALGLGTDLASARSLAYERLGKVHFRGMQFRKDIGGARD